QGVDVESHSEHERIESRTVIWAAGVQPTPLARIIADTTGAKLDRQDRVMVTEQLTVPGHPEIFVLGDLAHCEQHGEVLPGVAPVAMQQGRYAAEVIKTRLQNRTKGPFSYFFKGNLAVIGRAAAVADFKRFHASGWIAWML